METVKRRDVGVGGAIIVAIQALTSFQASHSVSDQIDKLKQDMQLAKVEREQFFVRKTDLISVEAKIDKLSDQLNDLKEQIAESYAMNEGDTCAKDVFSFAQSHELLVSR